MENDIGLILSNWPYDQNSNVRRIKGSDGRTKLQVRLPLGVEQYEIDGRPDGLRPMGYDSYLSYYKATAEAEGAMWELSSEDFNRLYEEGLLFYSRYLLFFRIGEYDRCMRDTARNLELSDFVQEWASDPSEAEVLTQYKPYILRMRGMCLVIKTAKEGNYEKARQVLRQVMEDIEGLGTVDTQVFRLEKGRSLVALRDLEKQLERHESVEDMEGIGGGTVSPVQLEGEGTTRVEKLTEELEKAVSEENYERAAVLRDEIKRLQEDGEP